MPCHYLFILSQLWLLVWGWQSCLSPHLAHLFAWVNNFLKGDYWCFCWWWRWWGPFLYVCVYCFLKEREMVIKEETEEEGEWKWGRNGMCSQAGSEQKLVLLGTEPQVKAEVAVLWRTLYNLKAHTMHVALRCRWKVKKQCERAFHFWEEGPLWTCPAGTKGEQDSSGNVTSLVGEVGEGCSHGRAS